MNTFANPIVRSQSAGDPWVVFHEGYYYFTATLGAQDGLYIWKSRTLTSLDDSEKVRVWEAPAQGPGSKQIWAPELHSIGGRWYLYFTASDGVDDHHRQYVLQSVGVNPLGPYVDQGRVDPEFNHYAIDGSVLRLANGKLYWMYCGGGLWIVPMESPLRVQAQAPRAMFARKTCDWEAGWYQQDGVWHRSDSGWIEAPQALYHKGRTFVIYSAGHTATPHYCLGLLELVGPDPLNPEHWSKHPTPVFAPCQTPLGSVHTVGHNSFTTSPDGTEHWLVYHARNTQWDKDDHRTVRAQRFTFRPDGTPDFGHPIPAGVPLPLPAGQG